MSKGDISLTNYRDIFSAGHKAGVLQRVDSLHDAEITTEQGMASLRTLRGRHSGLLDGKIDLVFGDPEAALVEEIAKHSVVVGCVAWLTSEPVLDALARKKSVQIIIQKEDFLRQDVGGWSKEKLRYLYLALADASANKFELGLSYSVCSEPSLAPVMCVGVVAERNKVPPRMHHKFFVFGDMLPETERDLGSRFDPSTVWTGSYNPTANAKRSIENAIIIRDREIARFYYEEWRTVLGIAESLDWSNPWVDPDFRDGT